MSFLISLASLFGHLHLFVVIYICIVPLFVKSFQQKNVGPAFPSIHDATKPIPCHLLPVVGEAQESVGEVCVTPVHPSGPSPAFMNTFVNCATAADRNVKAAAANINAS